MLRDPMLVRLASIARRCAVLALLAALPAGAYVIQPGEIAVPTFRLLIDRSHEWAFKFDDLSERILRPEGFDVVLSDAALDTSAKLSSFGVVALIQNDASNPAYSADETELLKNYARRGGSILIAVTATLTIIRQPTSTNHGYQS